MKLAAKQKRFCQEYLIDQRIRIAKLLTFECRVLLSFCESSCDLTAKKTKRPHVHSINPNRSQSAKNVKAEKLSRNPTIIAAFIVAIVTIAGWFIKPYVTNLINHPQRNVTISLEIVTKEKLSPAVVTYGPNSQVNIYQMPSQSETNLEVKKMDVNWPKDLPVNDSKTVSRAGY
jgi:hypothetical protein